MALKCHEELKENTFMPLGTSLVFKIDNWLRFDGICEPVSVSFKLVGAFVASDNSQLFVLFQIFQDMSGSPK